MLKRKISGMTLIEVIIVVLIISFLILIVLFFFRNQIFKGNDARRKGDLHKIQVALEEYEKDHDCYPTPDLVVCNPGTGLQPYLEKIPCDPVTKASYVYNYESLSCPKWYRIYTTLENLQDMDIGSYGAFNYYVSSPNAPGGSLSTSDYYGCRSNICVPILWDSARPGPECDPNYRSPTCLGVCPTAQDCKSWK